MTPLPLDLDPVVQFISSHPDCTVYDIQIALREIFGLPATREDVSYRVLSLQRAGTVWGTQDGFGEWRFRAVVAS